MSEATTTTAAASIALGQAGAGAPAAGGGAGAGIVQVVTFFFVAMGLRPDLLFAGMWGALASIWLLNNIPMEEKTWVGRLSQGLQRFVVTIISAVMAAYTAPMVSGVANVIFGADGVTKAELFTAFIVAAGARVFLQAFIKRYAQTVERADLVPGK